MLPMEWEAFDNETQNCRISFWGTIMKDILVEPIRIGSLQAKNRILMPPMYRPWSSPSGQVLDRHVAYYRERAEGGVGTIVVETTAVRRDYRLGEANIGIWADEHIEGLSRIARVIRSNNVLALIQINHTSVDRSLNPEEIVTIKEAFIAATRRAEQANFQGVELHAAHGFLLSRLLSSRFNQQDDEYGGSITGRMRLLLEIAALARKSSDSSFVLGIRLGVDSLSDGVEIAKKLSPLADYLSISSGALENEPIAVPPDYSFSSTVYRAEKIKPYVEVPVIAVGKIRTGSIARQILRQGIADLVAVGTAMLNDPGWPEKALRT